MSSKPKDVKAAAEQRTHFDQARFAGTFSNKSYVDPFASNYTYLDLGNGLSKNISGFKRVAAYINPFAIQQGSTSERIGFTPSINSKWWIPSPLTNNVSHGRLGPSHFDQQNQAVFSPPDASHGTVPNEVHGNLHISFDPLPLACVRPLQKFYRCKMINGEDACQDEADRFLSQCPNPVLAEMRNEKLTLARHRQIQLADYKRAVQVSDYNRGRSVSQVAANADYSWGMRSHLRPDTMWADERYANVTVEEIEAAKKSRGEMQKRFNARLDPKIQQAPHFDSNKQYVNRDDVPVYAK